MTHIRPRARWVLRQAGYLAATWLLLVVQGLGSTSGWAAAVVCGATITTLPWMSRRLRIATLASGAVVEGAVSLLGWHYGQPGNQTWGWIWGAVLLVLVVTGGLGAQPEYAARNEGDSGPGTSGAAVTAPLVPPPDELVSGAEAESEPDEAFEPARRLKVSQ
jgi:hypothetical protein